jgi:uncharacterized protein YeaO (DUF488 family)
MILKNGISSSKQKYFRELDTHQKELEIIIQELHKRPVTLLYSLKDDERNSAWCLKKYLERNFPST